MVIILCIFFHVDSSFRDVSALSGMNLATSVPVSIPLFSRHPTATAVTSDTVSPQPPLSASTCTTNVLWLVGINCNSTFGRYYL